MSQTGESTRGFGRRRTTGPATPALAARPAPIAQRRVEDGLHPALAESGRFEVKECLGSGSFGSVYAAYDKVEDASVALKWLRAESPATIARFKREFRALADLAHPNLVAFRELFTVGGEWFFTMDLVEGIDLLDCVRPANPTTAIFGASTVSKGSGPSSDDPTKTVALPRARETTPPSSRSRSSANTSTPSSRRSSGRGTGGERVRVEGHRPLTLADLPRLRATLTQLAAGLGALHAAGMLHRDIKPSNVLVTRTGQVILLDFGLVTEIGADGIATSITGHVVGTPAFMSPEQAMGRPLTPASDWYSVGVILYYALTGKLPYDGGASTVLVRKQLADPVHPQAHVRGVPKALGDLAMKLLAFEPDQRPTGAAFLELLHAAIPLGAQTATSASDGPSQPDFLGRDAHLWALEEALEEAERHKTVIALVHGESGMGKTGLVRRFLQTTRIERPHTVILEGRCYERESVPYKGLDSLVDALCRYLQRLPEVEVARLLPRDLAALARLFPVFLQFEGAAGKRTRGPVDLVQERRRAFEALRELLGRLADTRSLVLFIDDLQWGDGDSEPLLLTLLRAPDPPPLLLVGAYRSDAHDAPLVQTLARLGASSARIEVCEIPVGELSPEAACELATSLLDGRGGERLAQTLARESFGSPLFLRQLAAFGRRGGEESVDLAAVIRSRVSELSPEARRFLEILAVSGRPLAVVTAARAAGIEHDAQAIVAKLRAESLVRTRGSENQGELEVYHDRLREVVVAGLTVDELTDRHRRLARALSSAGEADAEALAIHFRAAGDLDLAARYAEQAAERAASALAFDRAATLYEMAIDLAGAIGLRAEELVLRHAEALANAGRGQEASERFLAAAKGAVPTHALELVRRASEQLLLSGRIEEGLEVIERILRTMKMEVATSRIRTVFGLLWRRVRLRFRGLRFKERGTDAIPREHLVRIDTCYSLALGLGMVDPIRGADFQTRYLMLALDAGEPLRIARGLALEAVYRAGDGQRARPVVQRLLSEAGALAERVGRPHPIALVRLLSGIARVLLGDFPIGVTLCDRAAAELSEKCTGVAWELDNAAFFACFSLLQCGRIAELRERVASSVEDARSRGDLYGEVLLRLQCRWFLHLADDDVESAEADLCVITGEWSRDQFLLQHAWKMVNDVDLALYRDDGVGDAALRAIDASWPELERSFFLRPEAMRVRAVNARARAVLAALSAEPRGTPRHEELLRRATGAVRDLQKERWPGAACFRLGLEAGIAAARGEDDRAALKLREASVEAEARGAHLQLAAAQYMLGHFRPDSDAAVLVPRAEDFLRGQGIVRPDRIAAIFFPGSWWRRSG